MEFRNHQSAINAHVVWGTVLSPAMNPTLIHQLFLNNTELQTRFQAFRFSGSTQLLMQIDAINEHFHKV